MPKILLTLLLSSLLLSFAPVLNAEKYAGEIFYMAPGVSHLAMGNTGVTDPSSLSAAWWNPALLAIPAGQGMELMHAEQFEGLMQFNQLSAVWGGKSLTSAASAQPSRMGLVITHIGIDDIALTKLQNDTLDISVTNRPYVWKKAKNNDLMAYFGIGMTRGGGWCWGITPKLAYRNLTGNTAYGFGADLGMLWVSSYGLNAGAVLKDCVTTQLVWENGTVEKALPSFYPELGYAISVTKRDIPIRLALGAEIMAEGRKSSARMDAGPFSADLHAGFSISPIPELKLMTGYDADAVTAGAAIKLKHMLLEYALKTGSQDDLGYSQRVSAGWKW
jgi:hypothetical protein